MRRPVVMCSGLLILGFASCLLRDWATLDNRQRSDWGGHTGIDHDYERANRAKRRMHRVRFRWTWLPPGNYELAADAIHFTQDRRHSGWADRIRGCDAGSVDQGRSSSRAGCHPGIDTEKSKSARSSTPSISDLPVSARLYDFVLLTNRNVGRSTAVGRSRLSPKRC